MPEVKVQQGQFLLEGSCPEPAVPSRLPLGLACGRHCRLLLPALSLPLRTFVLRSPSTFPPLSVDFEPILTQDDLISGSTLVFWGSGCELVPLSLFSWSVMSNSLQPMVC